MGGPQMFWMSEEGCFRMLPGRLHNIEVEQSYMQPREEKTNLEGFCTSTQQQTCHTGLGDNVNQFQTFVLSMVDCEQTELTYTGGVKHQVPRSTIT